MSRETHVRFCESAGVKLPRATHPGTTELRLAPMSAKSCEPSADEQPDRCRFRDAGHENTRRAVCELCQERQISCMIQATVLPVHAVAALKECHGADHAHIPRRHRHGITLAGHQRDLPVAWDRPDPPVVGAADTCSAQASLENDLTLAIHRR